MIVAVLFVGAFALSASTAKAADCTVSTLMKVGSRSADVTCLQTKLGMTTVTGYFGTMTKAAVQAFQANKGLTADGVVGAETRAALNSGAVVVVPPTPSTDLCPNGMTLASNCMTPATTTGTLCPNGNLLSNNCAAAGTTPVVSGAGDLALTMSTAGLETEVLEGDENTPVNSFKAQASGSSISVNNVKVSLQNNLTSGTSSTRLERYTSEVSVYMGSTKVGSALASDFTKTGTTYTKNIALTGATVAPGVSAKQTFWIKITALPNIDSNDLTGDKWDVTIDSVRYADGTGMTLTDTPTGTAVQQVSFSNLSAGDLKLTVSREGNPIASNVKVSATGTTDVLVHQFKLKATGSKMTVNSISLDLSTPTGAIADIVNDMYIKVGGNQVAVNDTTLTDSTELFTLDDPMEIAAGSSATFSVYGTINKIATSFNANGNSLLVSYSTSNVEDSNGDTVGAGNRSGTALGELQTFFTEGLTVKVISATTSVEVAAGAVATDPDTATFKWVLDLTAFGDKDIYVNSTAAKTLAVGASATDVEYLYAYDNSGTALTGITKSVAKSGTDISSVTGAAGYTATPYTGEGFYKILANSTGRVTITVTGINATDAKQIAAHLTGIEWTTDEVENAAATGAAVIQSYTTNLVDDSQTNYENIN
jgi:peptidoglycan hydrolase-like protein with peptidoglycan-binding domain